MDFKKYLTQLGGFWQHSAPGRYLALLTSGQISDTFCNCGEITKRPEVLEPLAHALTEKLCPRVGQVRANSLVIVGPGMGGITLAYALARGMQEYRYFAAVDDVEALFTEPDAVIEYLPAQTSPSLDIMRKLPPTNAQAALKKIYKFRFALPQGAAVILCEDVMTTGSSVQKTYDAIQPALQEAGAAVLPVVACLVDRRAAKGELLLRAGEEQLECDVVSLLELTARTWATLANAQRDVPGVIEALRPKQNWEKLVKG